MMHAVTIFTYGTLMLAIVCALVRLARGPTVLDRVLAFDLIATSAVGMILLLSLQWRTALYLELILIFSLLGFLTSVAFVFYLHRTVEPRRDPADKPASAPPFRSHDA